MLSRLIAPSLIANPLRGGSPLRDRKRRNKTRGGDVTDQKNRAFVCRRKSIVAIVITVYMQKYSQLAGVLTLINPTTQPVCAIEEYARRVRSCVWFSPRALATTVDKAPARRRKR